VLISGPVEVAISEWPVPTLGSRPHDPLAGADGAIWYTGQTANLLGRLVPKAGEFKEYPLKTPHTGPHGLVEDDNGNVWFTGNNAGLIGKLDPKTGAVTEYPCLTARRVIRARSPSTKPAFCGSPFSRQTKWDGSTLKLAI
jgi:virginiamycin B lyase